MDDRRTFPSSMFTLSLFCLLFALVSVVQSNDSIPVPIEDGEDKRSRPQMYNFGLGKRDSLTEDSEEYDSVEKRDRNRYNFGLGKRYGRERYSFGLGKRDRNRFNFGLGKREPQDFDFEDFIKRRYNFGLGKRSVSPLYPAYDLGRRKRSTEDSSVLLE